MKNAADETRMDRIERNLETFTKGMIELKESQDRTDAQLQKTIKKLDRIGQQLGDLGLVQGEVAEELFYRNVEGLFKPMDIRFQRIRRNVKVKGRGEYDIVADDKGRVLDPKKELIVPVDIAKHVEVYRSSCQKSAMITVSANATAGCGVYPIAVRLKV